MEAKNMLPFRKRGGNSYSNVAAKAFFDINLLAIMVCRVRMLISKL